MVSNFFITTISISENAIIQWELTLHLKLAYMCVIRSW